MTKSISIQASAGSAQNRQATSGGHEGTADIGPPSPRQRVAPGTPSHPRSSAAQGQPRPRTIGVLGGMGPAAANQFVQLANDAAGDDPGRLVLLQATDVEDRTAAIQKGSDRPAKQMLQGLRDLARADVGVAALTCNTAHFFHQDLLDGMKRLRIEIELVHIVDATMKELNVRCPHATKIGLLATTGTVNSELYAKRAAEINHRNADGHEVEWIVPDDETQARVMKGIYEGVKRGELGMGKQELLAAADHLAARGVDAMLLACTEIPLVLHTGDVRNGLAEIPMIDTLDALAKATLLQARSAPADVPSRSGMRSVVAGVCTGFSLAVDAVIHRPSGRQRKTIGYVGTDSTRSLDFAQSLVAEHKTAPDDQAHARSMIQVSRGDTPSVDAVRQFVRIGIEDVYLPSSMPDEDLRALQATVRAEKLSVQLLPAADIAIAELHRKMPDARNVVLLPHDPALARTCRARARALGFDMSFVAVSAGRAIDVDAVLIESGGAPGSEDLRDRRGRPLVCVDAGKAVARHALERSGVLLPATPRVLQRLASQIAHWCAEAQARAGAQPGQMAA